MRRPSCVFPWELPEFYEPPLRTLHATSDNHVRKNFRSLQHCPGRQSSSRVSRTILTVLRAIFLLSGRVTQTTDVNRRDVATTQDGSFLWTLEEISRLVSQSGNASETLTNIVHLIQRRFATDVCSVYLLEPDRANLVLAATIGVRPESVGRVRMRLTEGLAGLVAEQLRPQVVADATTHPRFKYFREAGEDAYHSFLGVPIVDRGLLQGVLVVQTEEPRVFSQDDVRMLVMAGAQLAPIVSEARTLGQFVAPAHQRLCALAQNLWWSWDTETTSLFRELDPVRWREFDNNPVALLQQIPIDRLEERASQLALHSRINYAYRRMHEYLNSKHTWGARHAGVLWARPLAYSSAA